MIQEKAVMVAGVNSVSRKLGEAKATNFFCASRGKELADGTTFIKVEERISDYIPDVGEVVIHCRAPAQNLYYVLQIGSANTLQRPRGKGTDVGGHNGSFAQTN